MSTILTLRSLGKSLKCSLPLRNCLNPVKYKINFTPAIQNYVTQAKECTSNTSSSINDQWRAIYHLPLIRLAAAFNRVKVSYGILNALIIPAAFALEQTAQLPPNTAILVSAVGVTSCCTLVICSFFVRNLLGFIYVNQNNDKLKLAYVDYWGKRQDVLVNLDDLVADNDKSKLDIYQPVLVYGDKTVKYKLLHRFGRIEDPETFAAIFGV